MQRSHVRREQRSSHKACIESIGYMHSQIEAYQDNMIYLGNTSASHEESQMNNCMDATAETMLLLKHTCFTRNDSMGTLANPWARAFHKRP